MQKLGKNRVKSTKKSKLVVQQLLRTQTRQGAQIRFTQRHQAVSQRGSRGRWWDGEILSTAGGSVTPNHIIFTALF